MSDQDPRPVRVGDYVRHRDPPAHRDPRCYQRARVGHIYRGTNRAGRYVTKATVCFFAYAPQESLRCPACYSYETDRLEVVETREEAEQRAHQGPEPLRA